MAKDEKKTKEIPGLKQSVGKEIIGNAIVMIIIVACAYGLTFHSWGQAKGMGTYLGFIACMIPFFTVMQAYVPFINKRVEYLHGKMEFKEGEFVSPAGPYISIWSLLLPRALAYGFGSMLIVIVIIKLFGWEATPFLTSLIVLIVNIITTTALLKKYLPISLISFASEIKEERKQNKQPLTSYLVVEHIIPFTILMGYINACVANRAFNFEALRANVPYVPTKALLPDAFIVFVLLALFQWLFSNAITRGDVHFGKVPVEKLKNLSGYLALIYIIIAGIIITVLYYIILLIGGVPGLSVGMAILFKLSIIVLSVAFGAWIGVRWGGARENEKMMNAK
jgi:hypothetical protein